MDEKDESGSGRKRDPAKSFGPQPNYNFPKNRFCPNGHAIIGDNIVVTTVRYVLCRTCARMGFRRHRRRGNLKEDVVRQVLAGLREGKTIANLTGHQGGKYVGGYIVDKSRLNRFCDENPKIGKVIRDEACPEVLPYSFKGTPA